MTVHDHLNKLSTRILQKIFDFTTAGVKGKGYTFKGDNSVKISFASLLKREKKKENKRKKNVPFGSKFIHSILESFSEGVLKGQNLLPIEANSFFLD